MKIERNIYPILQTEDIRANSKSSMESDIYDLDIEVTQKTAENGSGGNAKELITSLSLCTPGCGNTGTGNSFCC